MKKILFLIVCLYVSFHGLAQSDSLSVKVYNYAGKEVFIAFGYYAKDVQSHAYTIGWYKIANGEVYETKLPIDTSKTVFYHAHNAFNRNDNWGGEKFLMVHPSQAFWLRDADNALLAYAYDKGLNEEEEMELLAYPFREIKYSEEDGSYILVLK